MQKKALPTADIKARHLCELLIETLNQLLAYFEKNVARLTQEGDQKTLDALKSQLDLNASVPDILQTLKLNLIII